MFSSLSSLARCSQASTRYSFQLVDAVEPAPVLLEARENIDGDLVIVEEREDELDEEGPD